MIKRIGSFLVSACMLIPITASTAFAEDNLCTRYQGTNVEAQDYQNWGVSKNTFLTDCGDGTFMRFQSDALENYYIAEYYSADFNLISTKKINKQLPLFGAFYSTDENYYVISGQENRSESADIEVFRITKYDKEWNLIKSVGLKDCNTTNPFDAGTTSVTDSGGYLIIRTSHEMYADSNGTNHEANVTIQIDESTMTITDFATKVSNNQAGYVSHSFNQFVAVDNDSIVAIDHGDAGPRSICLMEYPTKVSSGKFKTNSVKKTDLLTFGGSIGDNYTGASIGGFEVSDSTYLTAYNQIDCSDYDWSMNRGTHSITVTYGTGEQTVYTVKEGAETRNVYIAVKPKDSNSVSLKQISSCSSNKTASTPHLVKINSNKYLVMWSEFSVVNFTTIINKSEFSNYYFNSPDNKVYYTTIDANGDQTESIYSFNGNLSDCQPILFDGNVIWNSWNDDQNTFYKINISDISSKEKITRNYTHSSNGNGKIIKSPTFDEEGIAEYTCDFCGETFTQPISRLDGIIGDADGDGEITIKDATIVQKYVVHFKVDIKLGLADYDRDGRITIKDATKIQKYLIGIK